MAISNHNRNSFTFYWVSKLRQVFSLCKRVGGNSLARPYLINNLNQIKVIKVLGKIELPEVVKKATVCKDCGSPLVFGYCKAHCDLYETKWDKVSVSL